MEAYFSTLRSYFTWTYIIKTFKPIIWQEPGTQRGPCLLNSWSMPHVKNYYWHRMTQLFLQCFRSFFEVCFGLAGSSWWPFGNQLSNKSHDLAVYLLPKFVSFETEGFKFICHGFTVLAEMQQAGCSDNFYFFVCLPNGLSKNFVSVPIWLAPDVQWNLINPSPWA